MKYIPLVLAGLWRKPVRTLFTFLSVLVAFVLFGLLSALSGGYAHDLDRSRLDRLLVNPRFGVLMPLSYRDKIASVPNVTHVVARSLMFGYFREPKNGVGAIMTDETFFGVRPEIAITPQQIAAFKNTRTGAVVGMGFAKLYGWKAGDKISLISRVPQQSGSTVWNFDIVAVVEDMDYPGTSKYFLGNYKYLDESRVANKGSADRFVVRINDVARAGITGKTIDRLFANSPAPTRTTSEKASIQSGQQELGDVNFLTRAVGGAVLFMLLFLTGNTMMQSVRERVPEFAVLKTLGYSNAGVVALVFFECLILCLAAGLLGLGLVQVAVPIAKQTQSPLMHYLVTSWSTLTVGLGFALLMSLLSSIIPALRLIRLNVVNALARH